jgi:Flavodoxin-like fold
VTSSAFGTASQSRRIAAELIEGMRGQHPNACITGRVLDPTTMPHVTDEYLAALMACGGIYSDGPAVATDFQEPYLRFMFGFLGLDDVTFVHVEGLKISPATEERASRGRGRPSHACSRSRSRPGIGFRFAACGITRCYGGLNGRRKRTADPIWLTNSAVRSRRRVSPSALGLC